MSLELDDIPLVDHHCHVLVRTELDRPGVERLLSEGGAPRQGASRFDTALGLAVRRHCAPLLDLPAHASAADYCARRAELGTAAVSTRLLRAARLDRFLVDTGLAGDDLGSMADLARLAGRPAYEVIRLERVAEDLAARGADAPAFADGLTRQVAATVERAGAVGVKSIAAYRVGLDFDPSPPARDEVVRAAAEWLGTTERTGRPRLDSPVLTRHLIWSAVELGKPIQFHIGYGDRDIRLHRSNPALLTELLHRIPSAVPVMLLHCYPFHREAGYLAAVYPNVYLDVGLTLTYLGPTRARAVLAETLELTPFDKLLFSTDAFGLPELYHLGALAFRRGLAHLLDSYVAAGEWAASDARRIARMIGADNARQAYHLDSKEA